MKQESRASVGDSTDFRGACGSFHTSAKILRWLPRITLHCDCGKSEAWVAYGDRWTCESCGRTYDTNGIPAGDFEAIQALRRRYRIIGYAGVTLVAAFVLLLALTAQEFQLFIGLPFLSCSSGSPTCGRSCDPATAAGSASCSGRGRSRPRASWRLRDRPAVPTPTPTPVQGARTRPVVLATLAVPFEPDAVRVALGAALESQAPLIVVDAVELPLWPQSIATRHADTELEADRICIRESVDQATALGLHVEHLRVRSPHPVDALLEVAGEREAACSCSAPTAPACGRAVSPAWCGGSGGGPRASSGWRAKAPNRAQTALPSQGGDVGTPGTGHVRAGPRLEAVVRRRRGRPGRARKPGVPDAVAAGERALEAACDARRREPLRPWRVRPPDHAAPDVSCCCGVHAVSLPADLAAYVPSVAGRRIVHRVVGRVALWGDVVEGSRGWRASRAYPAKLWVPEVHVNGRRVAGLEAMALDLAGYGVPVQICTGMTAAIAWSTSSAGIGRAVSTRRRRPRSELPRRDEPGDRRQIVAGARLDRRARRARRARASSASACAAAPARPPPASTSAAARSRPAASRWARASSPASSRPSSSPECSAMATGSEVLRCRGRRRPASP